MKYGQVTGKYTGHFIKAYYFPGRVICKSTLSEMLGIRLYNKPITFKAYDEPGRDRWEISIQRSQLHSRLRHLFSRRWLASVGRQKRRYWIPDQFLDALNIIPEEDTFFYVEVHQ